MRFPRVAGSAVGAAVLLVGLLAGAPASAATPLPTRMAALGDSISQASMSCSALVACPTNSWSTGTTASVSPHATRLRAAGAALTAYNDAVPGAVAADLPAQATRAVSQKAEYVTVQIGANDACADTVAKMTSVDSFRVSVRMALRTLAASSSKPQVLVASIPDLRRLWALNKSSVSARIAWATLGFCDSMLARPTSTSSSDNARRDAVQARVTAYNTVLAAECAAIANCRWDGGAVATYAFSKSDISTRDYFHPSVTGQKKLAALTWAKSAWSSL